MYFTLVKTQVLENNGEDPLPLNFSGRVLCSCEKVIRGSILR